ncbi:DUF4013 domain-containing protein [Halegenticoccus soli]|uniref:DUF4013 domain-containing protein n=1 Tax=Halegenticoccus soli TaxID=1985678 RepID=UPI000C6C8A9D|nr:DUF4013 domain-containing protein [Halegenticoccus soli]
MLAEALRYPARGDDAVETLLVGGGLHLLAVFVPFVPLVFVAGYLVRALERAATGGRGALRGGADPPAFRDLPALARDGVAAVGIGVAYLLVPAAALAVTVAGLSSLTVPAGGGARTGVGVLVGGTATLFVAVAFAYLLPAALANYAVRGRVRAAFDARALRRAATDAGYFVAWWTGVALAAVAVAAAAPLSAVVVGFFLAFYAEVAVVAVWGRGFASAVGE